MLSETLKLLDNYDQDFIQSNLVPLISEKRISKIRDCIDYRLKLFHIVCERPYDVHNAFATIRTSEALGIYNVHIVSNKKIKATGKATTQGAKRWVNLRYYCEDQTFFDALPDNCQMIAADFEPTHELDEIPLDKPTCIVLGSEHNGLSETFRERCDYRFKLPMYGMSQSFNLSIAGALILNRLVERYRTEIKPDTSDLDSADKDRLFTQYLIHSIGIDKAKIILKNIK